MAPLTVVFTDATTNTSTSWLWDFGDSVSTDVTEQNLVSIYAAGGNHTMTLDVNGEGGLDNETKTNSLSVTGLTANFPANRTTDVASMNISFDVSFTDLSTGVPSSTMDSRS